MTKSTRLITVATRAALCTAIIPGFLMFPGAGMQPAFAKAELERSMPEAGASPRERPATVEVWFSEAVTADQTWIVVVGPDGARVDRGDFTVDPGDARGRHVTVSLRAGLTAGDYTVHWNSSSANDAKETFGDFVFTLNGEAASCSARTPAASPVVVPCPGAPPEGNLGSSIAVEDLTVTLDAGGTKAGPVDLVVTLVDGGGNPVTDAQVTVRARHLEMDHGEFPKITQPDGAGDYAVDDVGMGMGGAWRVAVDVVRPGQDPVTAFFRVDLTGPM